MVFGKAALARGQAGGGAVRLAVHAGYTRVAAQRRQAVRLQAEQVQADAAAVERPVEPGHLLQDAVVAPDVAAAHAADADPGVGRQVEHAVDAAHVVVGVPALDHRAECVGDAAPPGGGEAVAVEPHGAGDAVQHRLAVAGHGVLDA